MSLIRLGLDAIGIPSIAVVRRGSVKEWAAQRQPPQSLRERARQIVHPRPGKACVTRFGGVTQVLEILRSSCRYDPCARRFSHHAARGATAWLSISTKSMPHVRTATERKTAAAATLVAGVDISHPERPIAEAPGHTKLDVVRYYERIGRWLLPQLAPRPIAVVKCMGGRFDDCFFQKHASRRVANDTDESPPFMRLADIADIVRTVQNGGFEFHTWGASFPRLDRPDRITLDLDPDPRVDWPTLQDAVARVRALLDALEIKSFV